MDMWSAPPSSAFSAAPLVPAAAVVGAAAACHWSPQNHGVRAHHGEGQHALRACVEASDKCPVCTAPAKTGCPRQGRQRPAREPGHVSCHLAANHWTCWLARPAALPNLKRAPQSACLCAARSGRLDRSRLVTSRPTHAEVKTQHIAEGCSPVTAMPSAAVQAMLNSGTATLSSA